MPFTQDQFQQARSILLNPIGDAVGDAVAAVAHLRQLRAAFPQARLGVFASDRNRAVLQAANIADEYLIDSNETYMEQRNRWDLFINYVEGLNANRFIQANYLNATFISASKVYQFDTTKIVDKSYRFPIYITQPNRYSHIRSYLEQSAIGKYLTQPAFFYLPPHPLKEEIGKKLWQANKLRVLLSPTGTYKIIQPNEFAAILNGISPEFLPYIDFLFGQSQVADRYCELLQKLCPTLSIRLSPKTSLDHFLATVDSSDLVISVDTGTVHLACAYQKPLAAFYSNCPWQLEMWKPSPINGTPTLLSIGANLAQNENDVSNFNHPEAHKWLNKQIGDLLQKKSLFSPKL